MFSIEDVEGETYCYLRDTKSHLICGHLYLLPKIHKIKTNKLRVKKTIFVVSDGYHPAHPFSHHAVHQITVYDYF